MQKTVYSLSTCGTCKRILQEIELPQDFTIVDIKKEPLTAEIIDALAKRVGSYEALFSRNAQLYKSLGLKDQQLAETQYRQYLLHHYTFLKRPVVLLGEQTFVGNSPATVSALQKALHND